MNLTGKRVTFIGDSITEGVGVKDLKNRYDNRLKDMYGLAVAYNHGISGSRIAHQSHPSDCPRADLCFCGRAYDLEDDADIAVVYGGINDYAHGDAPFGKVGDTTPATFCGAVYFLMKLLSEKYAGKTIVFLTPAHSFYNGQDETKPSGQPCKAPDACPVADYVRVIEETAPAFGVHVLNLYENLPVDPNRPEDFKAYTADGLHFNDEGHAVLARTLGAYLENL